LAKAVRGPLGHRTLLPLRCWTWLSPTAGIRKGTGRKTRHAPKSGACPDQAATMKTSTAAPKKSRSPLPPLGRQRPSLNDTRSRNLKCGSPGHLRSVRICRSGVHVPECYFFSASITVRRNPSERTRQCCKSSRTRQDRSDSCAREADSHR